MDLSDFSLVTSNPNKIAEFSRFGVDIGIVKGEDIEEVDGTPEEVILYKAIAAGANRIVEDSVILVDGDPMVDIRWKIEDLAGLIGKPIVFEVRLGVNDGASVHVFTGSISGHIVRPRGKGGFGFDPFFEDGATGLTLAELAEAGRKDSVSPRLAAIHKLVSWVPDHSEDISRVAAWNGPMQGI